MHVIALRSIMSLLALLAFANGVDARVVFRDDFNGTSLGPHWLRQPGITLEVGGGELRVTELSSQGGQYGRAAIGVINLPPLQDYRVTTRFDVPAGMAIGLTLVLAAGGGAYVGSIEVQYDRFTGTTGRMLVVGGVDPILLPAPPAGYNEYTLRRTGRRVEFELNGVLAAVLNDTFMEPVDELRLEFVGVNRTVQPARRVDFVEIIPTPGTFPILALGALIASRRPVRKASLCLPARPLTHSPRRFS
jgi:hypothetical protein